MTLIPHPPSPLAILGRAASLVCIGLLGCAAGPAPAAMPTWLPRQDLSQVGFTSAVPRVAVDGPGNAVVVWRRSNGSSFVVQAASRTAGGAWQPAQTLGSGLDPDVAMDRAGGAAAVWFDASGVETANRGATGTWGPPQLIGPGGQSPRIAVDGLGDAVAVWRSGSSGSSAAYRPAGGAWSAPEALSNLNAFIQDVAFDPAGNAVAVWTTESFGSPNTLQAASRPAGPPGPQTWQAPQTLDSAMFISGAHLAIAPDGTVTAAWRSSTGTAAADASAIRTASGAAGNGWQSAQTIASATNIWGPALATTSTAEPFVVWREQGTSGDMAIRTAHRPAAGGAWPLDTLATGTFPNDPLVVVDRSDTATALWEDGTSALEAHQAPGGAWSPPTPVAPATQGLAQVVPDGVGDALLVWSEGGVIRSAAHDGAPPLLAGLSLPTSLTAGAAATFSVSAADAWSALAGQPTWDFGDGTSGSGSSVSHVYADPGTYIVGVSQDDALGFVGRLTAPVSVASAAVPGPTPGPVPSPQPTPSAPITPVSPPVQPLVPPPPPAVKPLPKPLLLPAGLRLLRVRQGGQLRLRLRVQGAARIRLEARSTGLRRVRLSEQVQARRGLNTVRFPSLAPTRRRLFPGRYVLMITATRGSRQSPALRLRLVVTPAPQTRHT